ncbi:putative ABC transport system permease protein [Clostridium tetanomorphum]|uniref:FtsX-like permease family protein n=1 Tax=Clostridium tetanomorphum TaxID=1553 RepID=A0A923IZV4_CLOTT|nr:ABC transporter permease [Clostridium tetanomorphum]KAJ48791.1 ABC transporter permease protein [Clostridium tetanomorphum DSM 665]KAJ52048.1 ABC transporter permease protein [Clostridium tetanomorphum DSM 665]MBC2397059.1 FtsX-like permease family protein [Clostridium tetanomorphum]MBP1862968.1 putative ABC transport system permease protein [Clostridium tetanomorphum]NRS82797.1 putative ABC transport system permease protein [Clostridium tetanomorphum]
MNIFESFQSAFQSVRANKLRSFLTMLGIIIGISSVITIVSIGDGAKNFIAGEFADIGTNLINLKVNSSIEESVEERDYFTTDDIKLIKEKIPEITHVMPDLSGFGALKNENKLKPVRIGATNPDSQKVYNIKMIKGRYLSERDVDAAKNVVVLDEPTAKKLFNDTDIVGEKVKLTVRDKNIDLNIIGVCKDPNGNLSSAFGDNMPGLILMPMTIADRVFENTDVSGLSVILSDMTNADELSNKMIRLIENRHKNKEKYSAQKGFKELETINNVLNTLTTVLGAIAAISLLVGGIGVMNIMLVSVTERTREIGIRKAIGAKTKDIRIQFLMESVILCLIGGTIGTILGVSVGKIASSIVHVDVPVSIKVILVSFGFSSAVGIFFGLYPASKAAKLDPIEALRYE